MQNLSKFAESHKAYIVEVGLVKYLFYYLKFRDEWRITIILDIPSKSYKDFEIFKKVLI